MNRHKWGQKVGVALLLLVFSPLILTVVLIGAVCYLVLAPKYKKLYKNSRYCKDFQIPFSMGIILSPEYRFYNSAVSRGLPMTYKIQASNGVDYFIYDHMLFVFPDFDQIDYEPEKSEWQVNYDGDWQNFEEACRILFEKLEANIPDIPIRILVEREMVLLEDFSQEKMPECIFVTDTYENAFENKASTQKNAQNDFASEKENEQ